MFFADFLTLVVIPFNTDFVAVFVPVFPFFDFFVVVVLSPCFDLSVFVVFGPGSFAHIVLELSFCSECAGFVEVLVGSVECSFVVVLDDGDGSVLVEPDGGSVSLSVLVVDF